MLGGRLPSLLLARRPLLQGDPQASKRSRLNTDQLLDYHIAPATARVPLSTVAKDSSPRRSRSRSTTSSSSQRHHPGVAFPGVSQAEALETLKDLARARWPQGYSVDYGGASRQYVQETGGFVVTFALPLIIIYLSLAPCSRASATR